jgi:BirA family transcriptional regulator, biotin operon repressor / biotin---[acetyl-CoA-carboxylase] ligase
MPGLFHAEELLHYLAGLQFGHPVYLYRSLGSTNDEAKLLAASGAPEGLLVIAEEQTAGRGRSGRSWMTPPGQALACSVVLRPNLPLERATQLTMLAGVAVCRAIEQATPLHAMLKWPNDVLIAGKKVAGLLLETALKDDQLDYAVLGLGLNVSFAPPPEAVDFPATSLEAESETEVGRLHLLRLFLEELERLYPQLESGNKTLYHAWRTRLTMLGEPVTVRTATGDETGRLEGVTPEGALILQQAGGKTLQLLAGDVRLRPWQPI